MANYHVSKDKNKGLWKAQKEKTSRASSYHKTQEQAEMAAKKYSKNSGGGEVRIHSLKGPIRDSDTIPNGNDPCPPKDKKF